MVATGATDLRHRDAAVGHPAHRGAKVVDGQRHEQRLVAAAGDGVRPGQIGGIGSLCRAGRAVGGDRQRTVPLLQRHRTDRGTGVHLTGGHLQRPVATPCGRTSGIRAGRHIRSGQVGQRRDEGLAGGIGSHLAAVEQQVGLGIQRGRPGGHLVGACSQHGSIDRTAAEQQCATGAVRNQVQRIDAFAAAQSGADLREAIGACVDGDQLEDHVARRGVDQRLQHVGQVLDAAVDEDQLTPQRLQAGVGRCASVLRLREEAQLAQGTHLPGEHLRAAGLRRRGGQLHRRRGIVPADQVHGAQALLLPLFLLLLLLQLQQFGHLDRRRSVGLQHHQVVAGAPAAPRGQRVQGGVGVGHAGIHQHQLTWLGGIVQGGQGLQRRGDRCDRGNRRCGCRRQLAHFHRTTEGGVEQQGGIGRIEQPRLQLLDMQARAQRRRTAAGHDGRTNAAAGHRVWPGPDAAIGRSTRPCTG